MIIKVALTFSCALLLSSGSALAQTGAADQGKKAEKQQQMAQMASMAMAGIMMTQCKPPASVMPCAMAAMSLMQAGSLGGTSKGAGQNAASLSVAAAPKRNQTPELKDPNAPVTVDPIAGTPGTRADGNALQTKMDAMTKDLASKGVTVNPDGSTVKMPNGKNVDASVLGSAGAASAAGFSASDYASTRAAVDAAATKIAAAMKSSSLGLDGDGGGGGGRSTASEGGGAGGGGRYGAGFNFNVKDPNAKDKAALAGMSKNYGSDKIGVSADNIFEMITRRYKARDHQNNFFKQ